VGDLADVADWAVTFVTFDPDEGDEVLPSAEQWTRPWSDA